MKKSIITITFIALTGLLIASCNPTYSVFWAAINDEETEDYSLDNNITIAGMDDDGTNYYIAGGRFFNYRLLTGDTDAAANEWTAITMPTDISLVTAFTVFNSKFYLAGLFSDGTYRMYEASVTTSNPSWGNELSDTNIQGNQVIKMIEVNGLLFVSVYKNDSYYLYSSPDGTTYNDASADASTDAQTSPFTSVVWDTTNYWAVNKTSLVKGTAGNFGAVTAPTTTINLGEIYYDGSSKYYISTESGLVYSSDDTGATWDTSAEQTETSTDTVFFTGFTQVGSNILVGTLGYGFYEITGGNVANITRFSSISAKDVNSSSVKGFHIKSSDPGIIFFLTAGNGLFRTAYNSENSTFIHE